MEHSENPLFHRFPARPIAPEILKFDAFVFDYKFAMTGGLYLVTLICHPPVGPRDAALMLT